MHILPIINPENSIVSKGNIFGWKLKDNIGHHVGIILETSEDWKDYKIIHYGIDSTNKIYKETLLEAINRSKINQILFNTKHSVNINNYNDCIAEEFKSSNYMLGKYDCQQFVKNVFGFKGTTESDLLNIDSFDYKYISLIIGVSFLLSVFDPAQTLNNVIDIIYNMNIPSDITEWNIFKTVII